MAEEKPTVKKKVGWSSSLLLVSEEKPPKAVFVKGEETLDLNGAVAKLLNDMESIKEALLS